MQVFREKVLPIAIFSLYLHLKYTLSEMKQEDKNNESRTDFWIKWTLLSIPMIIIGILVAINPALLLIAIAAVIILYYVVALFR